MCFSAWETRHARRWEASRPSAGCRPLPGPTFGPCPSARLTPKHALNALGSSTGEGDGQRDPSRARPHDPRRRTLLRAGGVSAACRTDLPQVAANHAFGQWLACASPPRCIEAFKGRHSRSLSATLTVSCPYATSPIAFVNSDVTISRGQTLRPYDLVYGIGPRAAPSLAQSHGQSAPEQGCVLRQSLPANCPQDRRQRPCLATNANQGLYRSRAIFVDCHDPLFIRSLFRSTCKGPGPGATSALSPASHPHFGNTCWAARGGRPPKWCSQRCRRTGVGPLRSACRHDSIPPKGWSPDSPGLISRWPAVRPYGGSRRRSSALDGSSRAPS
jgi:hypothetical protein